MMTCDSGMALPGPAGILPRAHRDQVQLYNADCLVGMSRVGAGTVDLVLCDLPYGTDLTWRGS